ncbi:glycosyltransferase (plasmid) [Cereibacter azotoformans]|uniref:glycosyltransferase n=1 Tax=Cereibacter azotoformans TaxID=43057 RepID=UPI003B2221E2
MSRLLFITWDGPQTSYLTGLFLPILTRLRQSGHSPHVLQFTWGSDEKVVETKRTCESQGVPYRMVRVRRIAGGIGPFLTAVAGSLAIRRAVRDWKIDLLMPRSLMPALSVLCLWTTRGLSIVFDADGFAADERADFQGLSRSSMTYRLLKWVERRMVRLADSVMVRTTKAADILQADSRTDVAKFFVVTNGRDPSAYAGERPSRPDNSLRLCYVGSIGDQYLPDQMLELARTIRQSVPGTTLELFTGDTQNAVEALGRANLADAAWITVRQIPPAAIPAALKSCDLALALRKKCYSTQGVAPIKIGEYVMAGLPIIGTAGVGEVDSLIKAGVMFPFDGDHGAATQWVIEKFLPNKVHLAQEARRLGTELFGIERSVRGYEAAIRYARAAKAH